MVYFLKLKLNKIFKLKYNSFHNPYLYTIYIYMQGQGQGHSNQGH